MKKLSVLVISFILFALCTSLFAIGTQTISISNNQTGTKLISSSDYDCQIHFTLSELNVSTVKTKGGEFSEISAEGYGFTSRVGMPKLPVASKIITVPVGASVSFDVLSKNQRTYTIADTKLQHVVIPAQRSVSKSEDSDKVPFAYNQSVYQSNKFNDNDMFTISEIGYLRGARIFRIEFEPVRYNPVSGEMQVSYDVKVRVNFENPDIFATQDLMARTASYEFNQIYSKSIFNWDNNSRHNLVVNPSKMLILTPLNYVTTLQPFITWKRQQGYTVIVTTVGTGGTVANTTAALKTYMSGVWSAATAENPAPTYLLIVGDTSTSGDNITASAATVTSPASTHITDNYYVRLQGTDYVPEMYCGRFSVSGATELTNIINKTLQFEKTTMPDLSYLGNNILIAGVDSGMAPTYGNGQINYGTTNYFNATNGITSNTYLYPLSNTAVESEIIGYMSAGRGYVNYTAHGSETSWADPTVSATDLGSLTNTNKPFVAVGNCCVTNAFNYSSPCFGEAMIRGANKGGVAYIGATNNSYWDEDYWWGVGSKGAPLTGGAAPAYSATALGAYDAMFHTHGEAQADWAQTIGETNYIGVLAVEQSTSAMKPYYWEIYSLMGDPSLMPYYGVPTANTATYPANIFIGATTVSITAAPQSRVAISQNGVLYGAGITDAAGSLNLTITPFTGTVTADIVITRQNKITQIGTISVIPNSGPYVNITSSTYADANNNTAEYNEAGRFNVTFQNIGSSVATSIVATLTCSTAGITITDNTESIASLAAGASTTVNSAYTFSIANNIANGTSAAFTITMVSGTNTWVHNFNQTINAPALAFGSMTISDPSPGNGNGRLDPGETVTITMPLLNSGLAASLSGSATLTSPTTGITINTGTSSFSAISASGSASLTFNLTASSGITIGTVASLVFNATAGSYTANKTETTTIGIIQENFETGNFTAFPWTLGGSANWTVAGTGAHAGTYTAISGAIANSQTSSMETIRNLTTAGDISFWYSVSSESGYDYLKFYIDTVETGSWSGTVAWTQATYPVTTGTHTLKWVYSKDVSDVSGSDCAWVDDIIFPASTASYIFNPAQTLTATASHAKVALSWLAPATGTPSGYKIYRNSALLTTVTSLTYNDIAVTNGTAYSYYIIAVYTTPVAGESAASNTVAATPVSFPPRTLTGTAGNATVTLNWLAPTAGTPTGYKIYKNTVLLTTVTALTYTDNAVTNNSSYSYYITATYSSPTAESVSSNSVTLIPSNNTLITIGTGTSTQRQPHGMYFGYERDASLYLSSEIGTTGSIQSLKWYVATAQTTSAPVTIRMMTVTSTSLTASTWATMISGATVVYSSTGLSFPSTGWQTITLSSPFTYSTGNILVLIETNYSGTGASAYPYFNYSTAGTGTHQYWYQDDTAPTSTGTVNTSRPNLQIQIGTTPTVPVFSVTPSSVSFSSTELGQSATQQITISNSGAGSLGITAISINNSTDFQLTSLPSSYPASVTTSTPLNFSVKYQPTTAGSHNATITITDNLSRAAHVITISGTGVDNSVTVPYTQDFSSATFPPTNWSKYSGLLNTPSTVATTTSGWTADGYANNGTTGAARLNIWSTSTNYWLVSPSINLGAGNSTYRLEFDMALTAYNVTTAAATTGTDDKFAVVISTDNGATWTAANALKLWNNSGSADVYNNIPTAGTHISIPLGTYTGRVKVAFYGESTSTNADNDLCIDNVSINSSAAPIIRITPTSLTYGNVLMGGTANQTLLIQNIGNLALTGSILTPSGYDASLAREAYKNTLNFNLGTGQSVNYNIAFSPALAQAYNGNITITSNDTTAPTTLVAVTGTGYAPPTATLNLTAIEATVNPGESTISGFTFCNTGSLNMTYTTAISGTPAWISCDPASGTVVPSACYPVDVIFNATALTAGDYHTTITVNSNDPVLPTQNITVTLHVAISNHPPVIDLPASITFNKNQVYNEDFSAYASDADNDFLTLSCVSSRAVDVQINGLQATFSPDNNWYGSTQMTFTVSDGQTTASDNITIIVEPTDSPTWTPVVYPNNPATVYGIVTLDGVAADVNDQISAFVDDECRGIGNIVINSGHAYTTMLVNLATSAETVLFKVYDTSADLIYDASPTQVLSFGQVLGETTVYPISISTVTSLEAPVITIASYNEGFRISWPPVTNADRYRVISKSSTEAPDSLVYEITTNYYDEVIASVKRIFRVIAIHDNAARGGVK